MSEATKVLVQQNGNGNGYDARRINFNAVTAVALAFFCVGATFWFNTQVRERDERIGALEVQFDNLRLDLEQKSAVRWTVIDMKTWCLYFQLENRSIRCPDPVGIKLNIPQETAVVKRPVRVPKESSWAFWPF